MMELHTLYKHVCVGGSLLQYLVSLFPEMMIQGDPPMMLM